MDFRRTHNLMTKAMFPSLDPKMIDTVNERIDNVPEYMKMFTTFQNRRLANRDTDKSNRFMNNPMDIFGLTKKSHRKYGHDALSATLLGMVEARRRGMSPTQGALASYSHLAADSFSNHLINQLGSEGKGLFEALFLWTQRNKR